MVAQLQRTLEPGPNNWNTIKSNVCGWEGGAIDDAPPGNICNTAYADADPGYLFRGRVHVTVFFQNGTNDTTTWTIGPITS